MHARLHPCASAPCVRQTPTRACGAESEPTGPLALGLGRSRCVQHALLPCQRRQTCVRVCARVCVRACECVPACVRACACVRTSARFRYCRVHHSCWRAGGTGLDVCEPSKCAYDKAYASHPAQTLAQTHRRDWSVERDGSKRPYGPPQPRHTGSSYAARTHGMHAHPRTRTHNTKARARRRLH